ncbi:MAG: HAMP domain-containing protein, partial [Actinobacteria bacterium]|nr:HAMP domain-containing protein [Actinomycetota bacterium]
MRLPARVPIRVRLTLTFAGAMAVVLAATGAFLYLRLGATLDDTIDQSLRGRADEVAALVRSTDRGSSDASEVRLADEEESVTQVLGPGGAVVDATPFLRGQALLDRDSLARATEGTIVLDEVAVPGSDDPFRLLATPVDARDRERGVVVVGASLEPRQEALEGLLAQLLLGGPLALLISSLAGYAVAAAALRPVESMRREAEDVSAAKLGRRLPVSPARDEIGRLGETLNQML